MGLRRRLRREAAPMSEEQREREAARQAHTAEYAREEQQVLAALRSARLHVNDLPDLINELEPEDYKAQMPVLVDWLGRVSYPPVISTLARALAVDGARDAAPALIDALRAAPPQEAWSEDLPILEQQRRADVEDLHFSLGLAIAATAGPEHFDAVVELLRDPASGAARFELLGYAARFPGRRHNVATAVARELVDDEDHQVRERARQIAAKRSR